MDTSFLTGLFEGGGEARGDEIVFGDDVQGSISRGGADYWSFSGDSGDEITIGMTSEDFDTFLALFGPDDTYLICDDDGGGDLNAMISEFVLPSSGTYNIVATSYWGDVGGNYELELKITDTGRSPESIGGGALDYGDSIREHLNTWTGDVWTFSGEAGDRVSIRMESDDFDTYLDLWGPDLRRVTADDDGGGGTDAYIDNFTLPATGTYNIVARGFSAGDRGDYTLSLD
jgi:serine protease Do